MGCNCGNNKKKSTNEVTHDVLVGSLPGKNVKVERDKDGKIVWKSATVVKLNKN